MESGLEQVGARLRAARRERGWTLEELAAQVGLSPSTLSRLESGRRRSTLELLLPLTRRLGIRIDDLLTAADVDPRVHRPVARRDGVVIAPLTLESSPVQTFKLTLPARTDVPTPQTHDGYEWLFVLSGRVRLALGDAQHLIERGEAAEFDTRTPHSMSATAEGPAEVLSIFSASGVRMHTHGQA